MWSIKGQVMLKKPDMFGRESYDIDYGTVSSKKLAHKAVNHMNKLYYYTKKLPIHFFYEPNQNYSDFSKLIHHLKRGSRYMLKYNQPDDEGVKDTPKCNYLSGTFWDC